MENKFNWNLKDIFEDENSFNTTVDTLYDYLNEIKKVKVN